MKKFKILAPILGLTAITSSLVPLASCGCSKEDTTGGVIPTEGLSIKDVTLHGFKEDFDYKNYSKLVIPKNVKVIDTDAFNGKFTPSTKVTEIVIPGNVETIKKGAFAANNNITVYDFSSFTADQIYKLNAEAGAFALDTNGIYSFVKMNDEWTETQKETLKLKLIAAGIPAYCFVKQTTGNAEISALKEKEQIANGGEATNVFDIKGHFSQSLKYEAVFTTIEASEGVDIEHNATCTTSEDFKQVFAPAKMVTTDEKHTFSNDDYVTYKVTLICYTNSGTELEPVYNAQWCQTLDTFKVTYHNILESVAIKSKPTIFSYKAETTFDPDGLVLTATYSNKTTEDIAWNGTSVYTNFDNHVFTIDDIQSSSTQKAIAYYKYEDITRSAEFELTMLTSFAFVKATPKVTEYEVGQTYSKDNDLSVVAGYANPGVKEYTQTAIDPDDFEVSSDVKLDEKFTESDVGTHTVTVSYTDDGITKTDSYEINVTKPTVKYVTEPTKAAELHAVAQGVCAEYWQAKTGQELTYVYEFPGVFSTIWTDLTNVKVSANINYTDASNTKHTFLFDEGGIKKVEDGKFRVQLKKKFTKQAEASLDNMIDIPGGNDLTIDTLTITNGSDTYNCTQTYTARLDCTPIWDSLDDQVIDATKYPDYFVCALYYPIWNPTVSMPETAYDESKTFEIDNFPKATDDQTYVSIVYAPSWGQYDTEIYYSFDPTGLSEVTTSTNFGFKVLAEDKKTVVMSKDKDVSPVIKFKYTPSK